MNNRRKLIIALGAGALTVPLGSFAQQPGKVWRIGFFYNGSRQSAQNTGRYGAFLQGMRELGYVEGKSFVVEERFVADWDATKLSAAAAELVKSNVDLIVVAGGPSIQALKQATSTIPAVVALVTDPVLSGVAASLAHPGGNFTGLSAFLDEVSPKHIEFLQLVAPKLSRVGVLWKSGSPINEKLGKNVAAAAVKKKLQAIAATVSTQKDLEPVIAGLAQKRADAFIILGDTFFVQHARQIAELALRHRLPSIYTGAEYPDVGGLMSYGPNFADNFRRAATYVDKILKGAKPGDIPFEQPTRFYLTINKKTAKALGVTISNELLLRADKFIE
jgi:putative ABC transport system substrate-binding protein